MVINMEYPFEFIDLRLAKREKFVTNVGYQETDALFYMKEGSFRLDIGDKHELITSGDCVIFNEDIPFMRYVVDPIVFVYIRFRKNEKTAVSMPLPYGKVTFDDTARFLSSIKTYESLIDRSDRMSVMYKNHLLEDILLQLCLERGLLGEPDRSRLAELCTDTTVASAVEFIRVNIKRKLLIGDICKNVGSNPSTLNFKFRRELSCSVGEFIIGERMKKARQLLSGTTYPITKIAEMCGYENVFYFSRAFRNAEGEAPGEFRRRFI